MHALLNITRYFHRNTSHGQLADTDKSTFSTPVPLRNGDLLNQAFECLHPGRILAKSPSFLRIANKPCSGRTLANRVVIKFRIAYGRRIQNSICIFTDLMGLLPETDRLLYQSHQLHRLHIRNLLLCGPDSLPQTLITYTLHRDLRSMPSPAITAILKSIIVYSSYLYILIKTFFGQVISHLLFSYSSSMRFNIFIVALMADFQSDSHQVAGTEHLLIITPHVITVCLKCIHELHTPGGFITA